MKILHVLYSGLGGHSNVFFSMVKADKNKEYEFEALFNGIEEVRQDYVDNCNVNNIKWVFLKKKPGKHFYFLWQITKAIKKSNADIVFLHGSVHAMAAKLAKLGAKKKQKIIVRETQANHLKSKREWIALKLAMRLADKVVFLSTEYALEVKERLGNTYKAGKTVVIPNGLDLEQYSPAEKIRSKNIIIGMQSRLVAIKDHETLLSAFAVLKQQMPHELLTLNIAGDGEYRQKLEGFAASLNISHTVNFLGMLNETDLVKFLQSLDIYVHASLGETMSTAIMQAMACKLPIVASNVAGINNMIKDKQNGLLTSPGNVHEMYLALQQLIQDKAAADVLAKAAYQYAQHRFSNEVMLNRYKEIFN